MPEGRQTATAAILAELAALRRDVERVLDLLERRRLRAVDLRLLEAIDESESVGLGMAFTARGLLQAAENDPRLHAALEDCGLRDPICAGRRLGQLRRAGRLRFIKRDDAGVWLTLAASASSERQSEALPSARSALPSKA